VIGIAFRSIKERKKGKNDFSYVCMYVCEDLAPSEERKHFWVPTPEMKRGNYF
jgi:hypothetical protein